MAGPILAGALLAFSGAADCTGASQLCRGRRRHSGIADRSARQTPRAAGRWCVERSSTCILCHSGPFPEQRFLGDVAPSLAGTGSRWSEGELRLRLVDASRLNAATIMPSYYRVDGLSRVGRAWQGKTILSAEQIEDMVAYLVTLRE